MTKPSFPRLSESHDPIARPASGFDGVRLTAIVQREIMRYLAMPWHTVVGPALTACLFFAIFALAYGDLTVGGVTKSAFVAPGVILMAGMQGAFHSSAASMVGAKIHGSLADLMMSPLAAMEWVIGHLAAGISRVCLIALLALIAISVWEGLWPKNMLATIGWLVATGAVFSLGGLLAGIVTDAFDRMNDWLAFVVVPASFLSGAFFPLGSVPPAFSWIIWMNPAAHLVDGFRGAVIGVTAFPPGLSILVIGGLILTFAGLAYRLLSTGYRLRT